MGLMSIADVQPGMVLASPVYSPQEIMLLQEGTHITAKHIFLFKTWGVLEVAIKGIEGKDVINKDPAGPDPDNEELTRRQKALEHRFSNVLDNEIMAEIFRVAKEQLVEKFFSP
jgi:hypothetical protein